MPGKDDSAESRRKQRREQVRRRTIMRRRLIAIAVVAIPLVLIVGVLLSHGGGEEAPSGPTEQELAAQRARELARKKAREKRAVERVAGYTTEIRSGGGKRRVAALTFDDGPGPSTPEILKILRRTKTPATFFVVGKMVNEDPQMLKRVEREGHVIANHTQNHPSMGELDATTQSQEMSQVEQAVSEAGVELSSLFRPPYRSFNDTTVNLLQERGNLMVLWDVDTEDYSNPDPQGMVDRVLAETKPGSIILMHDGPSPRESTVAALPGIIRGLKKQNYRLVTIPQMMVLDPSSKSGGREAEDLPAAVDSEDLPAAGM